ncbi:MAG: hypothetical protein E5299_01926 [Burkholderia gladioli]|nr:MAG: hypothetical protein E5299_01926 [Burkholderia gladioli]
MKKSEKLAMTAAIFGALVCVGLNYWLGSEAWPWYVHAVIWSFAALGAYKALVGFAVTDRIVDN